MKIDNLYEDIHDNIHNVVDYVFHIIEVSVQDCNFHISDIGELDNGIHTFSFVFSKKEIIS